MIIEFYFEALYSLQNLNQKMVSKVLQKPSKITKLSINLSTSAYPQVNL